MRTSGVPSGIKVVFIFLINLKLTKTKEIPEMIRIKPNKKLRSIDIGKKNAARFLRISKQGTVG